MTITAADTLAHLRALPLATAATVLQGRRPLILAPHPDDESLGCGGLIAAACAAGLAPEVVILTDGGASHPGSTSHPPARLRALRAEEARQATAALGLPPDRLTFLPYEDCQLPAAGDAAHAAAATLAGIAAAQRLRHHHRALGGRPALRPRSRRQHRRSAGRGHGLAAAELSRLGLAAGCGGTRCGTAPQRLAPGHLGTTASEAARHRRASLAIRRRDHRRTGRFSAAGLPASGVRPTLRGVYHRMNEKTSRDAQYFERLYAANPDPWNFATSEYERRKYDATIGLLNSRRFKSGFEVGCSIGILTHRLAAHCEALLAVDIAPQAVQEARRRCAALTHVRIEELRVPEQWPEPSFDLLLFSEMLYFLTPADIRRVAGHACASLLPDGVALLVNFTDQIDEPCSGDEAAEIFIAAALPQLSLRQQLRDDKFRIDVLHAH